MKIEEFQRNIQGTITTKYKVIDERTKNDKGIEITETELELFMFVAKHRTVTFDQMYRYVSLKISKSRYSLYNRLRKMVDYRLLYSSDYLEVTPWSTIKVFSLTKRGLDVLYHTDFIKQSEFHRLLNNRTPSKPKAISDHAVVTSEVSSRLIPYHNEDNPFFKFGKPSDFPFLLKNEEHFIVAPDFVHQIDEDTFVYFEVDTGSERVAKIQEKVDRYKALSEAHPTKHHILVFVVVDDSMRTKSSYPSERQRRIRSIKRTFSNFHNVNSANIFNVWVWPLKSIVNEIGLHSMFDSVYPEPVDNVEQVIEDIYGFEDNTSHNIIEYTWYDSVCVAVFENKFNHFERQVAFVPMVNSDVGAFSYLQSILSLENDSFRDVDLFVAVYDSYQSLNDGVIPTDIIDTSNGPVEFLHRNVLSTYVHLVIEYDEFLDFYKEVGLSGAKEVVVFDTILNRGHVDVDNE